MSTPNMSQQAGEKRLRSDSASRAAPDTVKRTKTLSNEPDASDTPGPDGNDSTKSTEVGVAPQASAPILSAPGPVALPSLVGKFDIFDQKLRTLASGYQGGAPDYEALFHLMKKHQAKSKYTAQLALPDSVTQADSRGVFTHCGVDTDDAEIDVTDIKVTNSRLKATIDMDSESSHISFTGPRTLSLFRCWVDAEGSNEIFEGRYDFSVKYDKYMAREMGRDSVKAKDNFWAIRAIKDQSGKEIGLDID